MEPAFVELAKQLPVAVLFAVFIIVWTDKTSKAQEARDKLMRDFWAEQQAQSRQMVQALTDLLGAHDRKTDAAITKMDERTRPGARRKAE